MSALEPTAKFCQIKTRARLIQIACIISNSFHFNLQRFDSLSKCLRCLIVSNLVQLWIILKKILLISVFCFDFSLFFFTSRKREMPGLRKSNTEKAEARRRWSTDANQGYGKVATRETGFTKEIECIQAFGQLHAENEGWFIEQQINGFLASKLGCREAK